MKGNIQAPKHQYLFVKHHAEGDCLYRKQIKISSHAIIVKHPSPFLKLYKFST